MEDVRSGCLMLKLSENEFLNKFKEIIEPQDLQEFEDEFHCTIKYGFNEDLFNVADLFYEVQNKAPEYLKVNNLSLFENDNDVIKLGVILDETLLGLREICNSFPNEEQYPEYIPHITLAYVNKGIGRKYVSNGKLLIPTMTFKIEGFMYGFADENKKDFYFK